MRKIHVNVDRLDLSDLIVTCHGARFFLHGCPVIFQAEGKIEMLGLEALWRWIRTV